MSHRKKIPVKTVKQQAQKMNVIISHKMTKSAREARRILENILLDIPLPTSVPRRAILRWILLPRPLPRRLLLFDGAQLTREIILLRSLTTAPEKT
jgi:hypothetical protein